MKKFNYLRLFSALFIGSLIILIPHVRANPVPVVFPYQPMLMFIYLNLLLVFTICIEIFIIKSFLRNYKLSEYSKQFYISIVFVNLLTFPTTQIIAFIIFQTSLSNLDLANVLFISILIELLPITLECVLYLKIYKRLNLIACFLRTVSNKAIIKSTITANFTSFAFGVFTFLIFLI